VSADAAARVRAGAGPSAPGRAGRPPGSSGGRDPEPDRRGSRTAHPEPDLGEYTIEAAAGDLWFLISRDNRIVSTFFPVGGGRWRGVVPHAFEAVTVDVGDVADPHLVMAHHLVDAAWGGE